MIRFDANLQSAKNYAKIDETTIVAIANCMQKLNVQY